MESTRAPRLMCHLPLLEIIFDEGGFFSEERHMLMRRLKKIPERFDGLLERFGELFLLLVTPGIFKIAHLPMQSRNESLQFVVEPIQVRREAAQLGGVDMGFAHR